MSLYFSVKHVLMSYYSIYVFFYLENIYMYNTDLA